jgi:hypothetical protein
MLSTFSKMRTVVNAVCKVEPMMNSILSSLKDVSYAVINPSALDTRFITAR